MKRNINTDLAILPSHDITLSTDLIYPFTVFDQVFQKMMTLLYLYK